MTHMIQVCSDFRRARVFILSARPDEIAAGKGVARRGVLGFRSVWQTLVKTAQVF